MTEAESTTALTSTTAPGKVFASRQELADHYKSDWHKYNLKRREAGLPLLCEADFQARLAAAMSLRQQDQDVRNGTNHLKKGKKQKQKKTDKPNGAEGVTIKAQAAAYEEKKKAEAEDHMETEEDSPEKVDQEEEEEEETPDENENVVIDPKQCLFDQHFSASVEANVERMFRKYGFFLPDREYLTDLEGLVGYCHEKIKLGHMCLYCHKVFPTWQVCLHICISCCCVF